MHCVSGDLVGKLVQDKETPATQVADGHRLLERDCGALAGGLIGGAASHGNGGAVVGGAVLGGLLGNTISRDVDCDDQPVAFRVYADGLNGPIGMRSEWHNRSNYGYFTPTREFRRDGMICRDFTETSWRGGQSFTHEGTACRQPDGNWRFD